MTTEYIEAARGRPAEWPYARVPVNGKLPIGPIPISPDMLSPETLPVKASVSGIGLVMETFQARSSPLAVPSNISVELPSAPCVPVSVPPEFFRVSVALRSPIGVLMVRFQFPSTAIARSPQLFFAKPEWFWDKAGSGGGIAHLAAYPQSSTSLGNQARMERIRLVTRTRNAAYCTAKAATFAPIATTDT